MVAFFREFKQFINRGNVVDLAVGLAIGTAFQKIVSSLVNDIIFPSLAPVLEVGSWSELTIGKVLIGNFIKSAVDFVIIALAIFVVVRFMNRFRKKKEGQPPPSREEELLAEIRDLLKNK